MRIANYVGLITFFAIGCGGGVDQQDSQGNETTGTGGIHMEDSGETSTGSDSDGEGETTGGQSGEQAYELILYPPPSMPLKFEVNRQQTAELFGNAAKSILLVEVPSTELLTNTLNTIKNACGTAWKEASSNPNHDCSLTPLGQTFKGANQKWNTSPEYSLVRILTMTPYNAVVKKTSLESIQELADWLGIGDGFSQILSDSLQIAMNDEFIDTKSLVQALQKDVLATHPEIKKFGSNGQTIPITLEDALTDLATLGMRLGPEGEHPGLLDPSFKTHSQVLGADFQMNVTAYSNLLLHEGIDASQGKRFLSTIVDKTGPTFNDALEFDFTDPEQFSIQGVVESPQVDLRFVVYEYSQFVESCSGSDACKGNLPHSPVNGYVWQLEPWNLEYLIAHGGYIKYKNLDSYNEYALGSAEVLVSKGWASFDVLFNLGNPPEDQFVWDLISEVAQVAFHNPPDYTFVEGEADVAFTIHDVPIGVSGSEIAEAVRPYMQDQASHVSNMLFGNYKERNEAVDFFYGRDSGNGKVYLFFVASDDLKPGSTYEYTQPGFFSCPETTEQCKISRKEIEGAGDQIHEKYMPVADNIVYIRDEKNNVYRLRMAEEITEQEESLTVYVKAM